MRIKYLDSLKGFAILLVVIGHTIAWNFADRHDVVVAPNIPPNVLNAGLIWNLIYSFHMALFFMVSGFFSYKVGGYEIVWKKTKRLLVPYIFSGFLLLALRGYYGYWFLFSLWELSIIAWLMAIVSHHINKKNRIIVDVFLIVLLFSSCKFLIDYINLDNPICDIGKFSGYIFPFFFGWLMKKYDGFRKKIEGLFSLYFLLFCLLFVSKYYIFGEGPFHFFAVVRSYTLPVIGSLMCWEFFRIGFANKVEGLLSFIGRYTLDIYILHLFFVIQIPQIGEFWLSTNAPTCWTTQIIYSFSIAVISITLSIFVSTILHRTSWLSKLLFGQ